MGPLFSALMVGVVAVGLMVLAFAIMCFFLRWRLAAAFAAIIVVALGVGFLFGAMVQMPFLPETLTSKWAVLGFFAFATISAVAFASLAICTVIKRFKPLW